MSRRARRQTHMQKLHGVKKTYEKDFEKWQGQFITRAEVVALLEAYLETYDEKNVAEWREVAAYYALPVYKRALYTLTDWWTVLKALITRRKRRAQADTDG